MHPAENGVYGASASPTLLAWWELQRRLALEPQRSREILAFSDPQDALAAAHELGPYGVTVNIVSPGPVQTGYYDEAMVTREERLKRGKEITEDLRRVWRDKMDGLLD